MDSREFMKFCKDNNMINKDYTKSDVNIIFSKVVPKGQRRMQFDNFKDACRLIARKRKQTNRDIQQLVCSSRGPILVGTEAEAVRFHDDKSSYTGTHTYNEKHQGVDPNAVLGRHEKMVAETDKALHGKEDEEDDWGECERVFRQ